MDLYRIIRSRYADDLSGEGARLHGGRWNRRGIGVLYTSEHASLAALELLVHTSIHTLPVDLMMVILTVPDRAGMVRIDPSDLPDNWRTYPAPAGLAERGTDWISKQSSLLLRVPSAVMPLEYNVLINPKHPEIQRVKEKRVLPFGLNPRLSEI